MDKKPDYCILYCLLITAVTLLLLCGCRTKEKIIYHDVPVEITKHTKTTITERDTVYKTRLVRSNIKDTILIPGLNIDTISILKNKYSTSTVKISGGELLHYLFTDSVSIEVPGIVKEVVTDKKEDVPVILSQTEVSRLEEKQIIFICFIICFIFLVPCTLLYRRK